MYGRYSIIRTAIFLACFIFAGTALSAQQLEPPAKPELPEPETQPGGKGVLIHAPCDYFPIVFNLQKNSNERLMFVGNGAVKEASSNRYFRGAVAVWWNMETKNASITIQFPDGMICLLSPAGNFQPWTDPQPWEPPKVDKQSF